MTMPVRNGVDDDNDEDLYNDYDCNNDDDDCSWRWLFVIMAMACYTSSTWPLKASRVDQW